MKLRIKHDILNDAINKVNRLTTGKTMVPSLSGILFDLQSEKLTLTSSNSNISIQLDIHKKENQLQIFSPGITLIKGKFLADILRKMSNEFVEIEVVENKFIKIDTETFTSELNTMEADEFPDIMFLKSGKKITIESNKLRIISEEVGFAASTNQMNRTVLNSVYLKSFGKKLIAVATDSHRLARKEITINDNVEIDTIIPIQLLHEVDKLINPEVQTNIDILIDNRNISFIFDGLVIQSKIIEGVFPNVNKVIPEQFNTVVNISTRHLIAALDRASVLVTDNSNTETISISKGKITITSKSMEVGGSQETITNFTLDGGAIEFSINARLFIEALEKFQTEKVQIHLISEIKPIIIKSTEKSDLLQLVLPMKTF